MTLSIELFILDNLLMNYLMLRLAAALSGKRLSTLPTAMACTVGALYALFYLSGAAFFAHPAAKLLLGAAMALPLKRSWKSFPKAVLLLYVSAFFTGGLMLALSMALGGSMERGILVGTTPLRILLIGAVLTTFAPRLARLFISTVLSRKKRVRMLISFPDRTLELIALADSGNLLTDPLTGLPVVILRPGLQPPGGWPVPYETMSGSGTVLAKRPACLQVYAGGWVEIDCLTAESPRPLAGVDAIIDSSLLEEGDVLDGEDSGIFTTAVPDASDEAEEAGILHSLGGDAPGPVSATGGAAMDRTADEG